MAQQVQVIDAARPSHHPGHQARHLRLRVHPARPAEPDMPCYQAAQPGPLGEGYHRDQARLRQEMRVIERHVDLRQPTQQSHLRGVLSADDGSFSDSHRPSSEGTFRVDAPEQTPFRLSRE
jgi:hypothetical protein